jgi:uncharacterized protein (TIGR01777 family)
LRILVGGSSGLIGTELTALLARAGHEVTRLVRDRSKIGPRAILWDPGARLLDPTAVEGFDAVVNLAGEDIGQIPWNEARKTRIRESRVQGTSLLAETLTRVERRPAVFASASAIGYYGDRGDEELDEQSPRGTGFLADVCRDWEAATEPATAAGVRVVRMRFGVVLSPKGGAMAKMLPLFRRGLGGTLGGGRQYVSWIALDDCVAAIAQILEDASLSGPVNVTAPQPVTNRELTRLTATVLHRPAPLPAFALRLRLGRLMADELILVSSRVLPRRLMAAGHTFRFPELEGALRHLLG